MVQQIKIYDIEKIPFSCNCNGCEILIEEKHDLGTVNPLSTGQVLNENIFVRLTNCTCHEPFISQCFDGVFQN